METCGNNAPLFPSIKLRITRYIRDAILKMIFIIAGKALHQLIFLWVIARITSDRSEEVLINSLAPGSFKI